MKWQGILGSLLLAVSLSVGAATPGPPPQTDAEVHAAMHQIYSARLGDEGYCTAYATGPHTILIAAHCLGSYPAAPLFILDPESDHPQTAIAGAEIFDNHDHVIIELQHLNRDDSFVHFESWINVDDRTIPAQGDRVHFWGAPKAIGCGDCYREGYFSGISILKGNRLLIFAIPGIPGDSGSLIFNSKNQLLGVLSMGSEAMAGAFEFAFTPEQWEAAKR